MVFCFFKFPSADVLIDNAGTCVDVACSDAEAVDTLFADPPPSPVASGAITLLVMRVKKDPIVGRLQTTGGRAFVSQRRTVL